MTNATGDRTRASELANVRILLALAALSAAVAAGAGLLLILMSPEPGSGAEGVLGITAAIGGLATAAFAIAAAIYAQVRNLWQYAPTWLRVAAWVLIAIAVAATLWNLIDQLS